MFDTSASDFASPGTGQVQGDMESRGRREQPEHRLMAAVLQDAIKCMKLHGCTEDYRAKRLSRQARRWLLAVDTKRPYSFLWICKALDLDSGAVRSRLGLVGAS